MSSYAVVSSEGVLRAPDDLYIKAMVVGVIFTNAMKARTSTPTQSLTSAGNQPFFLYL